ncbi:hypothetical protein [Chrysiogenes arsenatis]|uniref:hypothetical protein n=1 Tax=Chrysiogenes arsenatis TaxID=309797 RepID=UPI00040706DD|nr:hypothetical protein [Chrysiogenes arsenatis]
MTQRQVRARLMEQGTNLHQFSKKYGYSYNTVQQIVRRWAGRSELPWGRKSTKIMRDLSTEIGVELIPGIYSDSF